MCYSLVLENRIRIRIFYYQVESHRRSKCLLLVCPTLGKAFLEDSFGFGSCIFFWGEHLWIRSFESPFVGFVRGTSDLYMGEALLSNLAWLRNFKPQLGTGTSLLVEDIILQLSYGKAKLMTWPSTGELPSKGAGASSWLLTSLLPLVSYVRSSTHASTSLANSAVDPTSAQGKEEYYVRGLRFVPH